MSVTAGIARQRYIGSGSTGPFNFNYRLYSGEHLTIVKTDTDGVDSALMLTTDYTVALASDFSSAVITLVSALAGDGVDDGGSEVITVTRTPPIEQLTRWPSNDPFPAQTHERAADLAVMMIGRLSEQIGRSLLLPESSIITGLVIPAPVANQAFGWNATADQLTTIGLPTLYVQASAPTGTIILNSMWIDSDSTDLDVFLYNGTTWVDTTVNLKGAQGDQGDPGADGDDGADGLFAGTEAQVTARSGDLVPFQDASDTNLPKRGTAQSVAETARVEIELMPFDLVTDVAVGDGAGGVFFRVPAWMNGFNITAVAAANGTAGTGTGTTTIQLRNVTQAADILSTRITIDSTETDSATAAAAAVINTSEDDLTTGDIIRVDVDAITGTLAAIGLIVSITAERPTS